MQLTFEFQTIVVVVVILMQSDLMRRQHTQTEVCTFPKPPFNFHRHAWLKVHPPLVTSSGHSTVQPEFNVSIKTIYRGLTKAQLLYCSQEKVGKQTFFCQC